MSEQKKAPTPASKQGNKPGFLSSLFKKSPVHALQPDAKQAAASASKETAMRASQSSSKQVASATPYKEAYTPKKSSRHVGFTMSPLKGFYSVASFVTKMFPMLDAELEEAGKETGAVEYTAGALAAFCGCFAVLAILSGFVLQIRFPDADFRIRAVAFGFSAAFSIALFFYMMMVPKWMASKRMGRINQDLLFATRHLMIQTSAGVPLFDAIVSVSEDFDDSTLAYDRVSKEYGEVGKEFARIVLAVRSGKELTAALEESAAQSPSENYRKVVWQLANANKTGARVGNVLRETVEFLAADQIISIRSYGAQLSTLALFYMLGCIIAPTMGIVVLAIGANILPNLPVNEATFGLILALLILVQAFFVGMIKSRRPMVSL